MIQVTCCFVPYESPSLLTFQEMCSEYWPKEGESVKHGYFTIQTMSERAFEDYVLREIEITDESVSV